MTDTAEVLRQFYGMNDDSTATNPNDIDGPDFQAEPHFQRLISDTNLSTLKDTYAALRVKIIQLDTDLQKLVYDNYTKFLLASETLTSMKTGLSVLNEQMKTLLSGISSVSEHAKAIREDLTPNRQKIQRLVGISSLLEGIEFISQLPIKLRAHVAIGNYESAVDIWMKAEGVLDTQRDYASFIRIRDECERIIDDIKVRVRDRMLNPQTDSTDAIACATTLIKLQQPAGDVLEELSKTRARQALAALEQCDKSGDVFALLDRLEVEVVASLTDFVQGYSARLLPFSRLLKKQDVQDEPMDRNLQFFRKTLFKALAAVLPMPAILALSSRALVEFVHQAIAKLGPVALFQPRQQFLSSVVRQFIDAKYDALHDVTLEFVTRGDAVALEVAFAETVKRFKTEVSRMILEFDPIIAADRDAADMIQTKMTKFLPRAFASLADADEKFALLAFGISSHFAVKLVPFVFELITRLNHRGIVLSTQGVLQNQAEATARLCLAAFVQNKRRMLSALIAQGMTGTDWLNGRSPHEVSISISLVLQELGYIWRQLEWLMGKIAGEEESSSVGSAKYSAVSGLSAPQVPCFDGIREDNVQEIDRFFARTDRLHLGKQVEFKSKEILTTICLYAVKTLLEYVRRSRFSCYGFHQIQIDAYFIYMSVFDKVANVNLFNALIEEVLSSAADRTTDPRSLKLAVLSNVYSQSSSRIQPEAE